MKIEIKNVSKEYIKSIIVLDDISFKIDNGEFVTLLGIYGAGKTTLLKLMTKLDKRFNGEILFDGQSVREMKRRSLPFVYLSDDYLLFDRKNVKDNIGYGMKIRSYPRRAISARTEEMAKLFNLDDKLADKVLKLSMVDKYFVTLARGLAREPKVVLLDSPFIKMNIDDAMFCVEKTKEVFEKLKATVIFATNSIELAKKMNSRLITLNYGKIGYDGEFCDSQYIKE